MPLEFLRTVKVALTLPPCFFNNSTFEYLDSLTVSLFDLTVNLNGISYVKTAVLLL